MATPSDVPSVTTILTPILGAYTAGAVSIITLIGFILVHVMPLIRPPGASAPYWWGKIVYPLLSGVTGNYGYARNKPTTAPTRTDTPPVKGVTP